MPHLQDTKKAESCPEIFCGRKLTVIQITILRESFQQSPECPTVIVLKKIEQEYQEQLTVSIRHINRLRVRWGLIVRKVVPDIVLMSALILKETQWFGRSLI